LSNPEYIKIDFLFRDADALPGKIYLEAYKQAVQDLSSSSEIRKLE